MLDLLSILCYPTLSPDVIGSWLGLMLPDPIAVGLGGLLILGAIGILIPIGLLWLECMAAAWIAPRESAALPTYRPAIDVLIPAHNEAAGLKSTLQTILPQLQPRDRLVVVADNCEDETAEIARTHGATVLERHDHQRRGKGYALDYGLKAIAEDPPEAVILFDADCTVHPGTIDALARLTIAAHRPIQALYLLAPAEQPPKPKNAISALAFTVKNWVRPLGLRYLGWPCLLTGNGMAFPWPIISAAFLAHGNLVEDMQLALDLAIAGHHPQFSTQGKVTGLLPQQDSAAKTQRTRWEHGHLKTLQTQVIVLLKEALKQRRLDLAVIGLDLSIPPLALLVMIWGGLLILALLGGLLGTSWLAAEILGVCGGLLLLSILSAWYRFCRDTVPLHLLLSVPLYLLWKLPLYLRFLTRPQSEWVRTDRSDPSPSSRP